MKRSLAICIATYRRKDLLCETLGSLITTRLTDIDLELRIVDNDSEGSARPVVLTYEKLLPFPVRYAIEPDRNIAQARNGAINMGPVDFVAFIDDDEIAGPSWLLNLIEAIDETKADAVFGPVVSIMPSPQSGKKHSGDWFDKPVPAGNAAIDWTHTRTSNTLVRGKWFYKYGFRFDPRYGRSGGSDTAFFARIGGHGARFASASRAEVSEWVEPERLGLSWMIRRRFRGGIVYHRITEEFGGPRPTRVVTRRIARCLALLATGLLTLPRLKTKRLTESVLSLGLLAGGLYAWLLPTLSETFVEYHEKPAEVSL